MHEGGPREGRFRREGGPMRQPDRAPDERRDNAPEQRRDARPDEDARRDGPQTGMRGDQQGRRFSEKGRGSEGGGFPPRMQRSEDRFAGGTGGPQFGQRPFGMRRPHRQMMHQFNSAPNRGNDQDFRRSGNEMRPPMPSPQRGPGDDRIGYGRGPGPDREQMDRRPPQNGPREMMHPRPDFERNDRDDRGPRRDFRGPAPQMNPPFPNDRGSRPERPHREGPPPRGWDEGQRQPA